MSTAAAQCISEHDTHGRCTLGDGHLGRHVGYVTGSWANDSHPRDEDARRLLEHLAHVPETPICLHLGDTGPVAHGTVLEVLQLAREGLAAREARRAIRRAADGASAVTAQRKRREAGAT